MSRLACVLPLLLLPLWIPIPAAAQWAPCGRDLSREAWDQWAPRAVSNASNGAIVAWTDFRNMEDPLAGPEIYARAISATGAPIGMIGGIPVCTAPGSQDKLEMVGDGLGGAFLVWDDTRNTTSSNDIYAHRLNSSATPQWGLDGIPVCLEPGAQSWPNVISDGAGGAIVAWIDKRNGTNWDIYVQRLNASGAPLWTAGGVALCTAPYDQLYPQLTTDGSGGAIVVWTDHRGFGTGTAADLYVRRIDSTGTPRWTNDGVPLSTVPRDQYAPELIGDGAGGAYITWHDGRSGSLDIYVQRVDASGTPLWTNQGKLYALNGAYPQIVPDQAGGAIFAWSGNGVYAQRVDGTGFPMWVSPGVRLSTLAAGELRMVQDGQGGAILSWHAFVSETANDVFAQSVSAAGVPGPSSDGVGVCNGPSQQWYPVIARSGTGAAIVAWQDERDYGATREDIYAMWTAPGGTPASVDPAPEGTVEQPWSLTLGRPYPSPSRGEIAFRTGFPSGGNARVSIYDASGRRITRIFEGRHPAGWSVHSWNGRDESGRDVASGLYFVAMEAQGSIVRRKLVMTR